jgi:hypothetical protein
MKYAIVKNGTVENIIQLEDGVSIPVDGELVKVLPESIETAQIGATWDGNVFSYISPPKPTPSQDELDMVSRRDSARSKLEGLGLTIDEIQAAFGI